MESNLLTECHIDTLMAKVILFPKKDYNHQKGCNNVLKRMREMFSNRTALCIIDDDKKKTTKDFLNFVHYKTHNSLTIYKHKSEPHYVITIGKAAENFILHCAEQCKILLEDYDLPTDLIELKKITKHTKSLEDTESKFKKLFLDIKQNENSDFCKLAQWIEMFKENPYNLDVKL